MATIFLLIRPYCFMETLVIRVIHDSDYRGLPITTSQNAAVTIDVALHSDLK